MLLMLDGIDGSGKSSIITAWKEYLTKEGNTIFDLKDYWKQNNNYPDYKQLNAYDFIFCCEPTYTGIGKVIREEFIQTSNDYSPIAIAEAYALDRLVLYKKIIVPALADGKCIIADRAVSTSLCYQHLEPANLSLDEIAALPGNDFALKYPPEHLILLSINPEIAIKRLTDRQNKQDNAIFEKLDFLKKAAAAFASEEYQNFFTKLGTNVLYLPAEDGIDIMKVKATELLSKILNKTQ